MHGELQGGGGSRTLTLGEKAEDLQPSQEKIGWVMTALFIKGCQVA